MQMVAFSKVALLYEVSVQKLVKYINLCSIYLLHDS